MMVFAIVLGSVMSFGAQSVKAAPAYDYQLISQSAYPTSLAPGATTNVFIEVKNTGSATWQSNVRLGSGSAYGAANQQRDYSSEFANSDWPSANRAAAMSNGTPVSNILPGWVVRFQFNIKAPTTAGTYKAYFTPVADGVTWMKDIGIFWQITVSADGSIITPITGTGLGVALASDSPVSGSVAISSQNAVFAKINLTAGSGSAVTVSSIRVKRGGVGADASISSIKLYDGATQVGSTQSLNLTYATFSQLALAIPAGTTKTLSIKANVSSAAVASSSLSLGINAAADVVLSDTAIAVSGSFPTMGNTKTVANFTAGDVDVVASSTTPTIAPGSTDNNLGTLTFSETSGNENVYLDAITLTTSGSAPDANITNVKIKDGATVIGSVASIVNRQAVINLNPDIKVTASGSKTLTVYADVSANTDDGRTVILGTNRKTDITAYGESSGGDVTIDTNSSLTFPINMGTATTNIGSLTVALGPNNPSVTTYVKGTNDRNFSAFKFTAGSDEGVKITELTITRANGADTDLNSIKLFDGATQIGSTGSLSGGSVTFYLTGAPIEVAKGLSKEIMVKASVSIGATTRAEGAGPLLKISNPTATANIVAYGLSSGIQLAAADINGAVTTAISGNAHGTAAKGDLAVSLAAGSTAASTLSPGITGVVFTKFNLTASSGEDIDVSSITVRSYEVNSAANSDVLDANEISNVKLMDGTTQIGSTVSNPTLGVATFAANLRIAAGATKTLSVVADVPSAVGASYIKFSIPGAGTVSDDITSTGVLSTADIVETGSATGNKMTIASGSIVVSMSATPVLGNVVINSADVTLANIILTAGNAEDVVVNSIKVSNTGTLADIADLSNIKLFDGATQIGNTAAALTNAGTDYTTFGSLALTVPASGQKVITVKATIPSTATADTHTIILGVATAADVTGTGVKSNATVSSTGTGTGTVQTIKSSATLTVSQHSSTPVTAIVIPGSTRVDYTTLNLYSDNENTTITDMTITRTDTLGSGAGDFAGLYIIGDKTNTDGTVTPNYAYGPVVSSGTTYAFSGLSIPVTKAVNKQIKVSAMLNAVGSGATSGNAAKFGIANISHITATGAMSNVATTISGIPNGNELIVRKVKPVVTLVTLPLAAGLMADGTQTLFKFNVAASGTDGGTLSLKKIGLTTTATGCTITDGTVAIHDADTGNDLTTDYTVTYVDGNGSNDFDAQSTILIKFATEYNIAAGSSKTFEVRGTVGAASTTDSIQTKFSALDADEDTLAENLTEYFINDTGNKQAVLSTAVDSLSTPKDSIFLWSDNSAATHSGTSGSSSADWTNAYRLNLPSTPQVLSKT
jgi:hypothetical protein